MFEKNLKVSLLLDFYADVLDEHTKSVMQSYYDDDLSLAEIASGVGISRQGVRHIIKKGEEQLEFLESRLGLAAHYEELKTGAKKLEELRKLLSEYELKDAEVIDSSLSGIIDLILNKGV